MARVVDCRRTLVSLALVAALSVGCAPREAPQKAQGGPGGGASGGSSNGPTFEFGGNGSTTSRRLMVTAERTTLEVTIGETPVPIQLEATENGVPVEATWTVDRGDIGSVSRAVASSVAFVSTGKTGGAVRVNASIEGGVGEVTLLVRLSGTQNGARTDEPLEKIQIANSIPNLIRGGGIAGVGGEGLGPAIPDKALLAALAAPKENGAAQGLALLYPYDGTVWPRGMLAPLLMWESSLADADGVRIGLSTASGTFSWTGSFGRPAILEPLRAAQTSDAARAKLGLRSPSDPPRRLGDGH